MKKSGLISVTTILLSIFLLPGLSTATDVGGIISSDTVWDLAHSPYTITSLVQIPDGVTLTIQPGVVVNIGVIKVWGILTAIGTRSSNITFNRVDIFTGDNAQNGAVNIQFAHFVSCHSAYVGTTGLGKASLTLLDSKLEDSKIWVLGTKGDSHIERNIFVTSGQNGFGSPWDNTNIYVRNNIFYQWREDHAVDLSNHSGMSNSKIIFEYNSFLTTDKIALHDTGLPKVELPGHTFNPNMIVANNYWGTTDTRVIDSMIYDRNDDLSYYTYFTYQPFLRQPHPDTPSLFEAPSASFTANPREGINRLTVNFTDQSTGNITSRSWNFGDGATITDQNPSHTYSDPGIFSVSLTVTGLGGSDTKTKPDYIIVKEGKAMPWLPLLLTDD